ncbi:MAG: aminoacyl-tRNA hydrolase [Verrucomicrobia bacterium]|nr:aminoacyl-tRNA hydrolase [Verrucomicrobiota bacterium]
MENTYLIVGLGNPGADYASTRHNVGFMAVQRFAERIQAKWRSEEKFQARLARAELNGRKFLLCEPQTYMNASGSAVRALTDYFKVALNRLLVVVDDADLPLGHLRLRTRGSSGGHHGLESIEQHLATRGYARLRIGIGRQPDGGREITDYVLGKFRPEELRLLGMILERVARQIECWAAAGIQQAMNDFNGVVETPSAKES